MNFNMKRRKIMKHTRKLTAIILAILCLAATGCKKSMSLNQTVSPIDDVVPGVSSGNNNPNNNNHNSPIFGSNCSSQYDPSMPHGEKRMYGETGGRGSYLYRSTVRTWAAYMFGYDGAWLLCYDLSDPTNAIHTCFDPLCNHMVDSCPAFYQFDEYGPYDRSYPYYIFLDYYDNANAPVFYSVYRQNDKGHIGTEVFDREPCYLIQRYDVSSGERITLLSGISDLVHAAFTYGDYLYYTTSQDYLADETVSKESVYTLWMLPKAGGTPIALQNDENYALEILDITDEGVYYLVNGQYLYRASLTLENPTLLMDVLSIQDENGNTTLFAGLRDNVLYYCGNLYIPEIIADSYKIPCGDVYQMPLSSGTDAVKIAENVICSNTYMQFSSHYLFYQPAVMSECNGEWTNVNFSNGTVKAVDLRTKETTTCCENVGINLEFGKTMQDDSVLVYGYEYESSGKALSGDSQNMIRVYADGRKYNILYNRLTLGNKLEY